MRRRRCAAADRRGSPGRSRPSRWARARRRRPWARPAHTPRRRRRPCGRQSRGRPGRDHGLQGRRRGRRRSRTCRSRQSTRRARRSNVTRYLATVSRPPGGGSGSSPRSVRTVATSTRPLSTARVTCSARVSARWSSHRRQRRGRARPIPGHRSSRRCSRPARWPSQPWRAWPWPARRIDGGHRRISALLLAGLMRRRGDATVTLGRRGAHGCRRPTERSGEGHPIRRL